MLAASGPPPPAVSVGEGCKGSRVVRDPGRGGGTAQRSAAPAPEPHGSSPLLPDRSSPSPLPAPNLQAQPPTTPCCWWATAPRPPARSTSSPRTLWVRAGARPALCAWRWPAMALASAACTAPPTSPPPSSPLAPASPATATCSSAAPLMQLLRRPPTHPPAFRHQLKHCWQLQHAARVAALTRSSFAHCS